MGPTHQHCPGARTKDGGGQSDNSNIRTTQNLECESANVNILEYFIFTIPIFSVGPSMYNFSKMAIEMNEPDEDVAPTDSRRRPDQRLMEEGKWDEANKSKNQLEDKQRKKRRQAEADAERAIQNSEHYWGNNEMIGIRF